MKTLVCTIKTEGLQEFIKTGLETDQVDFESKALNDSDAIALRRCRIKGIKKLYLNNNQIDDEGTRLISSNATWTNLEDLYLHTNLTGQR